MEFVCLFVNVVGARRDTQEAAAAARLWARDILTTLTASASSDRNNNNGRFTCPPLLCVWHFTIFLYEKRWKLEIPEQERRLLNLGGHSAGLVWFVQDSHYIQVNGTKKMHNNNNNISIISWCLFGEFLS